MCTQKKKSQLENLNAVCLAGRKPFSITKSNIYNGSLKANMELTCRCQNKLGPYNSVGQNMQMHSISLENMSTSQGTQMTNILYSLKELHSV